MGQTEIDSVSIAFDLRWKKEILELNKNYSSKTDTLQLSLVKFYVSNIEIEYNNGLLYQEKNSFHLIDIENDKTMSFSIPKKKPEISKVIFNIGIDSTTSVSGAMSGDLDVTKGMYWAWQSGYINMKLEGTSTSCKTRKNAFQFHIGGYLKPHYAMRRIEIPVKKSEISNTEINIVMDFEKLFSETPLENTNTVMIPGEKAMHFADIIAKIFSTE